MNTFQTGTISSHMKKTMEEAKREQAKPIQKIEKEVGRSLPFREDATVATASTTPSLDDPLLRQALLIHNDNTSQESSADFSLTEEASCKQSPLQPLQPKSDQGAYWREVWQEKLVQHSAQRQSHEQELLRLYDQATSYKPCNSCENSTSQKFNFILLAGPATTDKSNLTNVLLPILQTRGGFLVRGRFDSVTQQRNSRFQRPVPYEAFIETFNTLSHAVVLAGGKTLEHWQQVLHSQLCHGELLVLSRRIPALECSLAQDEADESAKANSFRVQRKGGSDHSLEILASKKFIFAFRKFVRAIGSLNFPIVMQLDDLHNADRCSLDMLAGLAVDAQKSSGLVIVGSTNYIKDDALSECCDGYMGAKWREIEDACGGPMPTITVRQDLDELELRQFLNDTFQLDKSQGERFANMVMSTTGGNSTYLLDFLQWLCTQENLYLDDDHNKMWQWDENVDVPIVGLSHYRFLFPKLAQLTQHEREVLKVSSCLGSTFEHTHIQHVLGYEVMPFLGHLQDQGILVRDLIQPGRYRFCHNELQRAAYDMIAEEEKERFHLEVGRRLWRKLDQAEIDRYLFLFLSQLYVGRRLIGRQKEQHAVALLCLHAGQVAASSSSFRIALTYFNFGIEMLPPECWRVEYELSLALFTCAAEMEVCSSNFENAESNVAGILENSRQFRDQFQAYATKMLSLSIQHNFLGSIAVGIEVLKHLGVNVPPRVGKMFVLREIFSINRLLRGKSDEQILRMRHMADETQLRILHIFGLLFLPAMSDRPDLACFIMVKSMKITLQFGLCANSAFAFCAYGLVQSDMGNTELGTRYGKLGLKLLDQFQALELLPRVYCLYYGILHCWSRPVKESLGPLLYARDVALQTGDFEFASMCGQCYGWISMDSGVPLEGVVKEWTNFEVTLRDGQQKSILHIADTSIQAAHHILGWTDNPLASKGDMIDFDETLQQAEQQNVIWDVIDVRCNRMKLAILFGDFELAEKNMIPLRQLHKVPPSFERVCVVFYACLILIELAKRGNKPRKNVRTVKKLLQKLRKWSKDSPLNFGDKAFLVEAELASFLGKNKDAYQNYLFASAVAKESGNLFMVGISNEYFAKHFVKLGNLEDAKAIFKEALDGYEQWQGHAKVQVLREYIRQMYGAGEHWTCREGAGNVLS